MRLLVALALSFAVLAGCSSSTPPSAAAPPLPLNFSGTWAGDAGPVPTSLNFGAKIVIEDDGGTISGEFYDADPTRPGVFLATGQIHGHTDGGLLVLTSGVLTDMGDAGILRPQQLTLTYGGGALVGLRVLQAPGRPSMNQYLILRKQ